MSDFDGVVVQNRQRKVRVDTQQLTRAVATLLEATDHGEHEVTLVLLSDRAMRALNRDYRGIDASTDVLSFAMQDGEYGDVSGHLLGDLVISLETVCRQAAEPHEDGRPKTGTPQRELALMTIHGLLHLLGYDHEEEDEAAAMVAAEIPLFEAHWQCFPEPVKR